MNPVQQTSLRASLASTSRGGDASSESGGRADDAPKSSRVAGTHALGWETTLPRVSCVLIGGGSS
jgi:hypothetical protein